MSDFFSQSKASQVSRLWLAIPRILLGVILIATWFENLNKGLYTADGFRGFMYYLAEGHPLGFYAGFLTNVIAPLAGVFGPAQMAAELLMGLALLVGVLTPLFGLGSILFFFNLFLAYLNPNLGEWIWTYVMLITLAVIVTFGRAGRSLGVDMFLLKRFGENKLPLW